MTDAQGLFTKLFAERTAVELPAIAGEIQKYTRKSNFTNRTHIKI